MDPQQVPPMLPHFLPTNELNTKISDLRQLIKKRRKDLKLGSSHDSEYWFSRLEVLELEKQLHQCNSLMRYREHSEAEGSGSGSDLTYDQWLQSADIGLELGRQQSAIDMKLSAGESQAARLAKHHPLVGSWVKLFFGASGGFGLGNTSAGPRDKNAQSRMRGGMVGKYHEEGISEKMPGNIWEPVCGNWCLSAWVHATHLYPWELREHMDVVFGESVEEEITTAVNGLFLIPEIEKALEHGYLAIVPDVCLEPQNEDLTADIQMRRRHVKDWEKTDPKEYKVMVLDNTENLKKKLAPVFVNPALNINSLEDLDGRRLQFRTTFRPCPRYKGTNGKGTDREVELWNRHWGTRGRYVKKNQLLGFVEHVGKDIPSIRSSSSLLGNAIEDVGEDVELDASLVALITNSTIRQASASLKRREIELDSEGEEDENESDEEDYF
ncbi:hypothetical protein AAE478_006155 [Parahypoxylon ruwenzoriense]